MSSNNNKSKSSTSSFDAFTLVDEAVKKPVFGSDAAASWQDFRKNNAGAIRSEGVAPHMPIKRADRVGLGFKSIQEEREHEKGVRLSYGHADLGSGYTEFKKKNNDGEKHISASSNSTVVGGAKRKLDSSYYNEASCLDPLKCGRLAIDFRERPDDVAYFIKSDTFTGWKKDYIFGTRHRGTGYYWDGMDSVKKAQGLQIMNDSDKFDDQDVNGDKQTIENKKKKKKKKKKLSNVPTKESSAVNPFQQVADAIMKRNADFAEQIGLMRTTNPDDDLKELAKHGWSVAKDSNTGKNYYYHNESRKTVWENPIRSTPLSDAVLDGKTMTAQLLTAGWSTAKCPNSGKLYYYHRRKGLTKWENPLLNS